MDGFGVFLLDFLGELAGGRGDPANDLPRFGLSAVFWFFVWGFSLSAYRRYSNSRERWLLVGCSIGLAQSVFMLTVKSLKLYGAVSADTLELFFPPLDHTFTLVMRAVIAAAFIHYLLQSRTLAVDYLRGALIVSALFYVVVAPLWWSTVGASPSGIKFSHVWADWVAHGIGALLTVVAMIIFFRARGWVFGAVIIAFSMFLLDDILMLINLASNEVYKSVFAPIRHNLQLWAILLFGYIYWREEADIHTRLVRQQQQSERLEIIGRLASGVAHDFNNHLQAILGFSEMGLMETNPKKQLDSFNHIVASTDRASALVNQLLSFSHQQKNASSENIYINRLIPELIPMLQRIIGSEITIHTEENLAKNAIKIEQSMLEQIIINLAVNARDAMPDGGHIHVKTKDITRPSAIDRDDVSEKKWIQIEFSDSGEGIDSYTLEHMFEPFFTTKEMGKGTGLGLATVQNIVQNHGGHISLNSKLGSGTTVCLTFPISDVVDEKVIGKARSEKLQTGSETILVAEDDHQIRGLTAGMLESAGYSVLMAKDGLEAVNIATESDHPIDLLLFDVAMPNLNGYRAYENITHEYGHIPILFFTANTDRVSMVRSEYQHMIKPVRRVDLLAQVREVLDVTNV